MYVPSLFPAEVSVSRFCCLGSAGRYDDTLCRIFNPLRTGRRNDNLFQSNLWKPRSGRTFCTRIRKSYLHESTTCFQPKSYLYMPTNIPPLYSENVHDGLHRHFPVYKRHVALKNTNSDNRSHETGFGGVDARGRVKLVRNNSRSVCL